MYRKFAFVFVLGIVLFFVFVGCTTTFTPDPSSSPTPSPSPAKEGNISGAVTDSRDVPLENVKIEILEEEKDTPELMVLYTDSNGMYSVDLEKDKRYSITFFKDGYKIAIIYLPVSDENLKTYLKVVLPEGDGEYKAYMDNVSALKAPDIGLVTGKTTFMWSKSSCDKFSAYILFRAKEKKRVTLSGTIIGTYTSQDTTKSTDADTIPKNTTYYYRLFEKLDLGDGVLAYVGGQEWLCKFQRLIWQKSFGGSGDDFGQGVYIVSKDEYFLASSTTSNDGDVLGNHGGVDLWPCMYGVKNIKWAKCVGGMGYENNMSVDSAPNGDYYIAGLTTSDDGDCEGIGFHGDHDYFIGRIDSAGYFVWKECLGGSDDDEVYAMRATSDGGCVLIGSSDSSDGDVPGNYGGTDVWVVKLNKNGEIVWSKNFGGSEDDEGIGIVEDSEGNFIFLADTFSNDHDVSGYHGSGDMWLVKLDSNGNILWQKCLGDSHTEYSGNLTITSDGKYFAVGTRRLVEEGRAYAYNDSYYVVKADSSGKVYWDKVFGGAGNDSSRGVSPTSDVGVIVCGVSSSNDGDVKGHIGTRGIVVGVQDVWLLRLSTNGDIVWSKCFGTEGQDYGIFITRTPDGNYVVIGSTKPSSDLSHDVTVEFGGFDVWMFKIDANGSLPTAEKI